MRKRLEHYLEQQPKARERKNKYRALGNILLEKYKVELSKEMMENIVYDAVSGDRHWRKILEERPELRGTDYSEKEVLEQQKQIELGYEVGYYRDSKLLNQ
jgi:hypothetical protein